MQGLGDRLPTLRVDGILEVYWELEMAKIIGGDFKGHIMMTTGWMGLRPKGDTFKGIHIAGQPNDIPREEITRVKQLQTETVGGGAAASLGGALAFGVVGAVAGAAGKKERTWGIEFKDGRKMIFRDEGARDNGMKCFLLWVEESGKLEFDF
jgi:hypothetical protein